MQTRTCYPRAFWSASYPSSQLQVLPDFLSFVINLLLPVQPTKASIISVRDLGSKELEKKYALGNILQWHLCTSQEPEISGHPKPGSPGDAQGTPKLEIPHSSEGCFEWNLESSP